MQRSLEIRLFSVFDFIGEISGSFAFQPFSSFQFLPVILQYFLTITLTMLRSVNHMSVFFCQSEMLMGF